MRGGHFVFESIVRLVGTRRTSTVPHEPFLHLLHIFMHISKNIWLFYNSNDNFKFLNPLMPYIPFKSEMRIYDLYLNFLTFVKNGK
jgi:hypothetical protein